MKSKTVFVMLVLMPLVSLSPLFCQQAEEDKPAKALNLERIADDTRFNNAYYFVELKQYDKALRYLGEYIEIYREGSHRKAALLAIGDIHYKRYSYQEALRYYMILFEEFSNSEEGVEAYYRAGLSYLKMGYNTKAHTVFESIVQNYPQFPAAEKARLQRDITAVLGE